MAIQTEVITELFVRGHTVPPMLEYHSMPMTTQNNINLHNPELNPEGPKLVPGDMYLGTDTDFDEKTHGAEIHLNWDQTEHSDSLLEHRREIADILNGDDHRIAIIVGPCSIEDIGTATEYITRLADLQTRLREEFSDHIKLIVRLYGEKPRSKKTQSDGTPSWWGKLAHRDPFIQPRPRRILDAASVEEFRELFRLANKLDLATATEFLNIETLAKLGHLPDFVAVGARTVENPKFAKMAKFLGGIGTAIGFKNDLAGSVVPAQRAMANAQTENPNTTIILRGGGNNTNWDQHSYNDNNNGPEVCVDVCHGNSNKHLDTTRNILEQITTKIRNGDEHPRLLMLEGHLTRETTITDPCLGFAETEERIRALAIAMKEKRQ